MVARTALLEGFGSEIQDQPPHSDLESALSPIASRPRSLPERKADNFPMTKNIGGRARRVEMSMQEFHDSLDRVYDLGIAEGHDLAKRELRDEIRKELEDELESFDPTCTSCIIKRELQTLRHDLVVAGLTITRERAQVRERIARDGRFRYRETKKSEPGSKKQPL